MAFLLEDEAIKGKKVKRDKPLLEMKVLGIKSEDNSKEDYMVWVEFTLMTISTLLLIGVYHR